MEELWFALGAEDEIRSYCVDRIGLELVLPFTFFFLRVLGFQVCAPPCLALSQELFLSSQAPYSGPRCPQPVLAAFSPR